MELNVVHYVAIIVSDYEKSREVYVKAEACGLCFFLNNIKKNKNRNKTETIIVYDKPESDIGRRSMFKILVVEDEKDLNKTVCSFLNHSGYEATGCLSAMDAYDAMEQNVFD